MKHIEKLLESTILEDVQLGILLLEKEIGKRKTISYFANEKSHNIKYVPPYLPEHIIKGTRTSIAIIQDRIITVPKGDRRRKDHHPLEFF